jgi:hypothetical protein
MMIRIPGINFYFYFSKLNFTFYIPVHQGHFPILEVVNEQDDLISPTLL